jgi:hypothetical protein
MLGGEMSRWTMSSGSAIARRLVRGVQPRQRAANDGHHDLRRHPLLALHAQAQQARQHLAVHVLHHQQQLLLVDGDDVQRRNDVGVLHARGDAGLVDQHRHEVGIARVLRVQPLDGHGAGEAALTAQAPEVTVAMPPAAISSCMT